MPHPLEIPEMLTRRRVLALTPIALLAATSAFADAEVAFSPAVFAAAQKEGKSILVAIHASWCPTCKAQKPIITGLLADPKFKDMVMFRMDFDSQEREVRAMKAQMQSTLVAFKGKTETSRSVGDTDPASIANLMASAL